MGPSGNVQGDFGPAGPVGAQKWRLTTANVTIESASSQGSADFTDLPVSSTSFVALAGYVVKHFYVSSKGIRNIYLSKPATGNWKATIVLANNLPSTTIPNCDITVFALAFVTNNVPTPGLGPGVPTGPITSVRYNS
jgi:hypothetical protein